jgi:hypothetical protein
MRRALSSVVVASSIGFLAVSVTPGVATARAGLRVHQPSASQPPGPRGGRPVKVACATLSGNAASTSNPPTISSCNHPNITGGLGTFPPGGLDASGTTTVSWQSGRSTTFQYTTTVPQRRGDRCGADPTSPGNKETEVILHGSVQPPGSGGVKGAVRAKFCLTSTGDISLLSGQFVL